MGVCSRFEAGAPSAPQHTSVRQQKPCWRFLPAGTAFSGTSWTRGARRGHGRGSHQGRQLTMEQQSDAVLSKIRTPPLCAWSVRLDCGMKSSQGSMLIGKPQSETLTSIHVRMSDIVELRWSAGREITAMFVSVLAHGHESCDLSWQLEHVLTISCARWPPLLLLGGPPKSLL